MKHYRKILFMLGMVTTLNTNLMAFEITSNTPETGELNWVESNIDYYTSNRNSTRPTMKFLNTAFNWGKPSTYWDGLGSGANGGHQSVTTRDFLNRCTAAGSDCRQLWSVDHYNQSTGTVVNYTRKYLYKGVPVYATEFEEHGARHDRHDLYHGLLLDRGYLNTIGVSNTVIDNPENNATVIRNLFPGNASLNIDGKANTDASNINTPEWKNKIGLTNNGNDTNYMKVDGSNLNDGNRGGLINSLTTGSNIDNPTNTLVTDTTVKYGLDRKANNDLSNVNFGNLNQATKQAITDMVNGNIQKGNVVSNTLTVTNGNGRIFGSQDLRLEVSQTILDDINSKVSRTDFDNNNIAIQNQLDNKVDNSVYNANLNNINNSLNRKANVDGSNITSQADKESFRNALDVYSKDESAQVINNAIANQSGGEIKAGETRNVSGQTVYNYLDQYYLTKDDMTGIKNSIDNNSKRINELDKKIGKAVGKIAGATAIANIPNLQYDQKTAFGAAFGVVDGASAVALGVTGQNNRKTVVYKASVSADSKKGFSGGAGLNIGVIK